MAAMRTTTPVLSHSPCVEPSVGFLSLFLAVILLGSVSSTLSGDHPRTLQSFGVQVKKGQPVYPLPSTVALGLFNSDPLLDVAFFDGGKVQVYQNMGNGMFEFVGERSVLGDVDKMEWRKERMFSPTLFNQFSWGELHITCKDGSSNVLSHEQLIPRQADLAFASQIPARPPLDFRERWRSQTQTQLSPMVEMDDIDNDGRIEVAYSFYHEFSDSSRLVIYECDGDDSFRVDWDSVLTGAVGPMKITDIDNDGHKEIVLVRDGEVVMLECLAQGRYRYYGTNIGYSFPPFKVIQTDIDHNGRNELVLLTSNPSPPSGQYPTLIYVAEFVLKSNGPNGWTMIFNQQIASYGGYTFDMAIGQVDGTGRDEIILGGGAVGVNEPVPVGYLWHNGTTWITRSIYTGLYSGSAAPMFVKLDADSTKELFIGGVGPLGHGSLFALKHQHDTTWSVLWADSSLRNAPLCVNAGILAGQFVVAGATTWDRSPADTLYTQLHVYLPSGDKLGIWQRDTESIQSFHILDLDNDARANLITAMLSPWRNHLADYEYYGVSDVGEGANAALNGFQLFQNYPNPFNPATAIGFYLTERSHVRIEMYDILGREVRTLIDNDLLQGACTLTWNGTRQEGGEASSGVYFCRMIVTGEKGTLYVKTQKMLLMH